MGKKLDIDQIQDDAREGYSLFERLSESNKLTKTVTVYTDNKLGAELGYAVDAEDYGIKTGERIRKGLIGELDELKERAALVVAHGTDEEVEATSAEIDEAKKRTSARIAKLQREMKKSALVFTLQSVPEFVLKDARRKTRKALGIKGKGIPEAQEEDFGDEYTCQVLAASTVGWEDKKAGKKFTSLHIDEARNLKNMLPRGQFPLLDEALVELSMQASIHNAAVDDVDF